MNTEVLHYQLHLALLDIQQLNDIAVRIEEGASTDVMEILTDNVDKINDRQGIETEPLNVLAIESYQKRNEIALEGISDSLTKIWSALGNTIGSFVSAIKKKFMDSMTLYKTRIVELEEVKKSLLKLDQKATFDISKFQKYAQYLADETGEFKITDAAKNLNNFNSFIHELFLEVAHVVKAFDDLVAAEITLSEIRENPLTSEVMDYTKAAQLANKKSKDDFEYTFGGQTIKVVVPGTYKLDMYDIADTTIKSTKVPNNAKVSGDLVTVGEAVKMIDACIHGIEEIVFSKRISEKLMSVLDDLSKTAKNFKEITARAYLVDHPGVSDGSPIMGTNISSLESPLVVIAFAAVFTKSDVTRITVKGMFEKAGKHLKETFAEIDNRRKNKEYTNEDAKLIRAIMSQYSKIIQYIAFCVEDCVKLSDAVVSIQTTGLDESITALEQIAKTALKAEVK